MVLYFCEPNITLVHPINIYLIQSSPVQAVSFGGSNIDPTAWEDKKCKGESRFPAQV